MYFSAFSFIVVLTFRFIRTLLVHTLIALVVFGLLCKYVYLLAFTKRGHLTELMERQLNKQLSLSWRLSLVTTAISKQSPACLGVPASGCAIPAAECWNDCQF